MVRNPTIKALNRRLWSIALPLMLANSSVALFGLVDSAVVGHLDNESYLAGVATATVIFDFLYWGVTFLRMGTTGIVAQFFGARQLNDCANSLVDGLLIAVTLGLMMLSLAEPILSAGLALVDASSPAELQAAIYFKIKIWAAPGVLASMVLMGWLIGMQQATAVLMLTALVSVVNIGLDLVFVVGFGMGVAGVAWASLIACYLGLLWGGFIVLRVLAAQNMRIQNYRVNASRIRRILSLNTNILVRTLCLICAFALFTRFGAQQGDTILAANALLLSLQMLLALALDGYANALEVLVGKSLGARSRVLFCASIRTAALWAVITACGFSLFYFFCGQLLINLLTDIAEVRDTAGQYLVWMLVSPIISVWCFVFDGIFIGATQGKAMRNSMLFALFVVYLPSLVMLANGSNHGLWAAFMLFFAARGVSMMWLFFSLDKRDQFVARLASP